MQVVQVVEELAVKVIFGGHAGVDGKRGATTIRQKFVS